ncbi:MAG TPA: lyase family protein [Caldimonas sp.]|jgi:3-carboxy-cis,cis-muconate cycloisomerase|nr:lyase family protein [Caldimonas sp.]
MTASIFARTLASAAMVEVFADRSIVAAMLAFESALAEAEAAEGAIPPGAAAPIAAASRAGAGDVDSLVDEARRAGSLAIPLVKRLTATVAERDEAAAAFVHHGSTSQDVIDTAMVIVTKRALALIDADLARLSASLRALARAHLATPMLARTLLQPAQVISFGFKLVAWVAPLLRARDRLAHARDTALRVQLGGAVGTLATLGDKGPAVARRLAAQLGLATGEGAWHVQRDDWVALGCEVAVLCGSLGKIGRDIALLAQAEVGEVAEPSASGRGGSSAMPQKRNPVAAMTAIAASVRAPHHAAALLAAMAPPHERGLGEWQAELAEWPSLFLETHGALAALADACGGLEVNAARMRENIDRQHGTVFAEAAAALLVPSLGKAKAHELLAALSARAVGEGGDLHALLRAEPSLRGIDATALAAAFDVDAAARRAGTLAAAQLDRLAPSPPSSGTPR